MARLRPADDDLNRPAILDRSADPLAEVVERFAAVLRDISPAVARRNAAEAGDHRAVGMTNWSYPWFRPGGPMSRATCADHFARTTVDHGGRHLQLGL